jgi:hypothetical protein
MNEDWVLLTQQLTKDGIERMIIPKRKQVPQTKTNKIMKISIDILWILAKLYL